MNNALKAKLIKRIGNALSPARPPFTSEALKSLLIDVRDLLELLGEAERYKALKFHCDWVLHSRLTGGRVQRIIKAVDIECAQSVAKAGLQEWPKRMGSDFFGPVSDDFTNQALDRFTFHNFEADLQAFLGRHHIATLAAPGSDNFRNFEVLYCELVEDRTWEYTNKKDPTFYVNRLRVEMRPCLHRGDSNPGRFPLALRWNFLWNEEERIMIETEFLLPKPNGVR